MKTKFILFMLLMAGLFTACYEDNSNLEIKDIAPLVIDLGGASTTLSVYLLDTLEVAPIVYKNGVDDADLSYKWEISGNDIVPQLLGTNMILKAVIGVPENSKAYSLLLTVTDNTTSLQSYQEFKVTVSAKLGQGLLVADTKDGLHSDLNLIVSSNFRGGLSYPVFNEKNSVTMTAVYSQCNAGQYIDGLVTHILATGEGSDKQAVSLMTVITEKSAYWMDPHNYLLQGTGNDFFYVHVPEGEFKPELLTSENTFYHEMMIVNGMVYVRESRWGNLNYGAPLETSDYSEYEVHTGYGFSNVGYPNYRYSYFYDEMNDRFLECQDYERLVVNSAFKLNLGKQKALYMGEGENGLVYTVFRSEGTGDYLLYTFKPGNSYPGGDFEASTSYNLNACTDIGNAKWFETSRNEKVLYYATDSKIYAATLTDENPQSHVCLEVADLERFGAGPSRDEEITSLLLWKRGSQGTIKIKSSDTGGEPTKISAQNRMMVISVWDKSTGKGRVITVPIMNIGAGVLEKDSEYWQEYTGFGRILCMEPQGWV